MKRIIPAFALILFEFYSYAQSAADRNQAFVKAYQDKDYAACIENGEAFLKVIDHPNIRYKLSECYCKAGKPKESVAQLHQLAKWGLPYDVANNPNLQELKNDPVFIDVQKTFSANRSTVDNSSVAFVLKDSLLIPEGLASDEASKTFFMGSLAKNKIITFSKTQPQHDLISSNQDNIWSVVGMKVSPDRKSIWVCSATERDTLNGYSAIFQFDLKTGKLLKKIVRNTKDGQHFFNDVVVTHDNRVYFTDSKGGKVWLATQDSDQLTEIASQLIYPNGIALDEANNTIYVADFKGLQKIDIKTKKMTTVNSQNFTYMNGIDGLYFYKGSLIAIQDSGNNDDRVVRFYLDKKGEKLIRPEILQSFRSDFIIPTTGAILGNEFYYIANSQLRNLKPNGAYVDAEKLKAPIILRIKLD
jgi:WD40 repeat protein